MPTNVKGLELTKLSSPRWTHPTETSGYLSRTSSAFSLDSVRSSVSVNVKDVFEKSSQEAVSSFENFWRKGVDTASWHARVVLGRLEGNLRNEGVYSQLHRLPPHEWFIDFMSPDKKVRLDAYNLCKEYAENEDAPWRLPASFYWENIEKDLSEDPNNPAALIAMRALIYCMFGDAPVSDIFRDCRLALERLDESTVLRRYGAHLLRRNFVGSSSGKIHQSQLKLIHGRVGDVREIYRTISRCIAHPELSKRIFDVPDRYFKSEFSRYVEGGQKKRLGEKLLPGQANLDGVALGFSSKLSCMASICSKIVSFASVGYLIVAALLFSAAYGLRAVASLRQQPAEAQ